MARFQAGERAEGSNVVQRVLLLTALVTITAIVLLNFTIFGTSKTALELFLPGVLAGLVTGLVAYVVSMTALRSANKFQGEAVVEELRKSIAEAVTRSIAVNSSRHIPVCGWYETPWKDILPGAREVDVAVSYMDTWINHVAGEIKEIFRHGGVVRMYLPLPGSQAALRVRERFPEYTEELVEAKIKNTPEKLHVLWEAVGNHAAQLEIYWTTMFCMWCLVKVDNNWLIVSPFDHVRRGHIENPTFLIPLDAMPEWAAWATKELQGFKDTSVSQDLWPQTRK